MCGQPTTDREQVLLLQPNDLVAHDVAMVAPPALLAARRERKQLLLFSVVVLAFDGAAMSSHRPSVRPSVRPVAVKI